MKMENKEIICEYTTTLDYYKKGYRMLYSVDKISGQIIFFVFLTLFMDLISDDTQIIMLLYLMLIISILFFYFLPIIKYKNAEKKHTTKRVVLIGEREIKTNININLLTSDVRKIYENKDFYLFVAKNKIRLLLPKSSLNISKDEFESFVLKHFNGLKNKKIIQVKTNLIKTIIFSLLASLLCIAFLLVIEFYLLF